MELSSSNIKKILILPEMDLSSLIFVLYFRRELSEIEKKKKKKKKNTLKKFLIFWEMELCSSYIFSKKKFFYFRRDLQSLKNKNFLYFTQKFCTDQAVK